MESRHALSNYIVRPLVVFFCQNESICEYLEANSTIIFMCNFKYFWNLPFWQKDSQFSKLSCYRILVRVMHCQCSKEIFAEGVKPAWMWKVLQVISMILFFNALPFVGERYAQNTKFSHFLSTARWNGLVFFKENIQQL